MTRPVTDRVKQSLFDILSPELEGARVYDLFAGTGSMGLECLSRGASHVSFFEADRSAVLRLKKNIAALGVPDRSDVIAGDLFRWFETATATEKTNVVFLDPPYRFLREQPDPLRKLATQIAERHLAADGVVVFRHDAKDRLELPGLKSADERTYGGMTLEFLRAAGRSPEPR